MCIRVTARITQEVADHLVSFPSVDLYPQVEEATVHEKVSQLNGLADGWNQICHSLYESVNAGVEALTLILPCNGLLLEDDVVCVSALTGPLPWLWRIRQVKIIVDTRSPGVL